MHSSRRSVCVKCQACAWLLAAFGWRRTDMWTSHSLKSSRQTEGMVACENAVYRDRHAVDRKLK